MAVGKEWAELPGGVWELRTALEGRELTTVRAALTSKRTKKKITRGQYGRKTKRSLKPPTCLSEESKQGLWHRPVTSRSQEAETGDGELEAEPVSAPAVVPQPQHLWGAVLIALLGLSVLGRGMEQTEFLLASDRLQKKIKHSNGFLSTSTHIAPPHTTLIRSVRRPLVSISIIFHMVYWPLVENIREKIIYVSHLWGISLKQTNPGMLATDYHYESSA